MDLVGLDPEYHPKPVTLGFLLVAALIVLVGFTAGFKLGWGAMTWLYDGTTHLEVGATVVPA